MRISDWSSDVCSSDLLINFISATGMLEAIFIDAEFEGAAIDGRPVPAALTQCMIEGLLFQTMIQGTGLALLEMTLIALKPVRIGDTVWATVTVTGITRSETRRVGKEGASTSRSRGSTT